VGKRSENTAHLSAMAEGCVQEDMKDDKLQKGWGFQVGSWNVD